MRTLMAAMLALASCTTVEVHHVPVPCDGGSTVAIDAAPPPADAEQPDSAFGWCQLCGQDGRMCCANHSCGPGLTPIGTGVGCRCQPCGALGQNACASGEADVPGSCQPGLVMARTTGLCQPCGASGQHCCGEPSVTDAWYCLAGGTATISGTTCTCD